MKETIEYQNIHENRKYKDSLFRMVSKEKEDLLDLYNAINGTEYDNPEDLEINTLESVLYISMKNDISFLIDGSMNLYEHQSTKNANMPLRGLLYFARLLNINYGQNRELMEKCRRLEEYAIFVETVRKYKKEDYSLKKAIILAIDECIEKGILLDILTKERNEVVAVVLETFNKELYEKNLKADAYEDGVRDKLLSLIRIKLEKGKSVEQIADELEETVEMIQEYIKTISAE